MNLLDSFIYFMLNFTKFGDGYERFNKKSTTIETIYFF